jgi:hypothetical protein
MTIGTAMVASTKVRTTGGSAPSQSPRAGRLFKGCESASRRSRSGDPVVYGESSCYLLDNAACRRAAQGPVPVALHLAGGLTISELKEPMFEPLGSGLAGGEHADVIDHDQVCSGDLGDGAGDRAVDGGAADRVW